MARLRKHIVQALLERLASENRRVVSDWRVFLYLQRIEEKLPETQRDWGLLSPTSADCRSILKRLEKGGYLTRVNLINRPFSDSSHFWDTSLDYIYVVANPFAHTTPLREEEVLMEAHPYAALCFMSAMQFHELTLDTPNEFHMATPPHGNDELPIGTSHEDWAGEERLLRLVVRHKPQQIWGHSVFWHRTNWSAGLEKYFQNGSPMRVTNLERTLVDGLMRPDACGGFSCVVEAWRLANDRMNIEKMVQIVEEMNIGVLKQRVGFMLEFFGGSHQALDIWQSHAQRGGSSKLIPSEPYAPKFSERWSLSINGEIRKDLSTMHNYPKSFADLRSWAAENRATVAVARRRFAQYGILLAISNSRSLKEILVFKGGNALDFMWHPNRSTLDLDFSSISAPPSMSLDIIKGGLERSLPDVTRLLGTTYKVQSAKQNPPGEDKIFITYAINIGYALSDETQLLARMANDGTSTQVIPIEVSINEPICKYEAVPFGTSALKTSHVDDIVAEKLRSLLQQPIRNRRRKQDVLDISSLIKSGIKIDRKFIAEYLKKKCAARDVPLSRDAFRNDEIRKRAEHEYDNLRPTARNMFIKFSEAFPMILELVDTLPHLPRSAFSAEEQVSIKDKILKSRGFVVEMRQQFIEGNLDHAGLSSHVVEVFELILDAGLDEGTRCEKFVQRLKVSTQNSFSLEDIDIIIDQYDAAIRNFS